MSERTGNEVQRARRIELGVYLFTAVSLVGLGVVLTSKILNWIVGPAYVVTMVSLVTPLVLRLAGVADPDAGSFERWRKDHSRGPERDRDR